MLCVLKRAFEVSEQGLKIDFHGLACGLLNFVFVSLSVFHVQIIDTEDREIYFYDQTTCGYLSREINTRDSSVERYHAIKHYKGQ